MKPMTAKVKRGDRRIYQKRMALLQAALDPLAKQGASTAEIHARRGLMLNVYNTVPGEYDRTKNLLRSVYASGQGNGATLGILVGDNANYASLIEYGTGPHEMSPAQLQQHLEVLPKGGLLRFGRTGQAYLLPGPYIGPAIIYARTLTRERLHTLMQSLFL